MDITENQLPDPPKVLEAVRAGFDSITRHIVLVLFPLGIDLLFWFAPRLRIKHFIEQFIAYIASLQTVPSPELEEVMEVSQEVWLVIAERFNLLIALRSYPVGVFSFMSSLLPLETPIGEPIFIEFSSLRTAFLIGILFMVSGVVLGALFFSSVAQASLNDEVRWGKLLSRWPWVSGQALLMTLIWVAFFVGVTVFGGCLITGITLISTSLGQMAVLAYGLMLSWILFPLFFSAHGIFVNKDKAWRSLVRGAQLTAITFVKTSLFILLMIFLSQGMNFLWQIPPEDSWLMMISVLGHAFVSTGALAASFVYYNDMVQWAHEMRKLQEKLEEKS